ncbi:MAG: DUF4129 domain-containing protein [Acidimicrobiales bacterium]
MADAAVLLRMCGVSAAYLWHIHRTFAVRGELPPLEHDADEVRDTADDVLARPEFQEQKGLLPRFFEWLADLLDFDPPDRRRTPGSGFSVGPAGTIIGWVLIVVLLVLAGYLVARFLRLRRFGRPPPDEPDVEIDEEEKTADQWRGDAETLEAAGRWREAMLARYRGLVRRLVEAGVLEPIPGRTSGEYRDELAARLPAVADPFDNATDLFEDAWYGNLPTGPDESSRFRHAAERVLEGSSR